MNSCKIKTVVSWTLQLLAAVVLAQTLFFKFSGAEESRYIFRTLGAEPWGRVASGLVELVAVALLLAPRTVTIGALIALGVMAGALVSHLTKLGIVVQDDGGLLFGLAITVFVSSGGILLLRRGQIPVLGQLFAPSTQMQCGPHGCRH
ncbi:MAG: DoxX family protein [Verrucomicrobiales bacterium]|nr:DoxX family protein [Verrucomicrobiales bacterium]